MSKYYSNKIQPSSLEISFDAASSFETSETGVNINFNDFNNYFKDVKNGDGSVTIHDFKLSELIYEAILSSGLDKKFYYDLRFWQYVCLNEIKDYCLWRWKIDEDSPSKIERLIGAGGVTGFSKNSASRLFFPADCLLREVNGKELLEDFWSLTQNELSISQSTLSINPKIFVAMVKATNGLDGAATKNAVVKLNLLKTSLFLDIMDEDEILSLIT